MAERRLAAIPDRIDESMPSSGQVEAIRLNVESIEYNTRK